MKRIIFVLAALGACIQAGAQRKHSRMQLMKPSTIPICYASMKDEFTTIDAPRKRATSGRTKSANIIVTYEGFTGAARTSFQEAVDIWESILETPVTIRIHAQWTPLGAGVLGSAGPGTYSANFDGAPKQDVWYPIALAERIAGEELNDPADPDIVASFNSSGTSWHFGLTGSSPPSGTYDLMSVVLHEIGHGLGITNSYSANEDVGFIPAFYEDQPVVYETNIIDGLGNNLVNEYTPPSAILKNVLTSNGGFSSKLFYSSPYVRSVNGNANATIYAPKLFDDGSSIAHLDENTYETGTPNSLMTPFIGMAERVLDPGAIAKAILAEIGWVVTTIDHDSLKDTENVSGPYPIVVRIETSNGYDPASVKLHYKSTGLFTEIQMTATGNSDEYTASIPGGSTSYSYFVSVKDVDLRTYTQPGVIIEPGSDPEQGLFDFNVGPDTEAPVITHTPIHFITTNDDLDLQANVTDNIGVDNVKVEWKLNDVAQPDEFMVLVPDSDETYRLTIGFVTPLEDGDMIEYRIRAEDVSAAGNVSHQPSPSEFYEVSIEGFGEAQDSYANNFNTLSDEDFFGNGFTVSKPGDFNDGAIHSDHPYAAGGEGGHVELIYNLKVPVRIAEENAVMRFDEIVLVEPGEPNVSWPDDDFYDYVVVEGTIDGGVTWIPLADGYDSRTNDDWLDAWNASSNDNNSLAVGSSELYRPHSFNLQDAFEVGDEVAFRFRLYSDPFSFGWGWSIDNLRIQIDETPPTIEHDHFDFIIEGTQVVDIKVIVTDLSGVKDLVINFNNTEAVEVPVSPGVSEYIVSVDISALNLQAGDDLLYQIYSRDNNDNLGQFPSSGNIVAKVISFQNSVDQVVADFEEPSQDLVGNFFNIEQPNIFGSSGFATTHPYDTGYVISFLTKTPVKINSDNPMIYYEDIALVEYGDPGVKDYVVVEASKDGVQWEQLIAPYAANAFNEWKTTFDRAGNPAPALYQKHVLNITEGGKFSAGDLVLIRFRLYSDAATAGWGWIVDNVSIQGPVTGVEEPTTVAGFDAWPNPISDGSLNLSMTLPSPSEVNVEIFSTQGQVLSADRFSAPAGDVSRRYEVAAWPSGFYVVRVRSDFGTAVKKIIKLNSQN